MARGKHAVSAHARHEIASRDSEIAIYQKNVARLTAENKRLRARVDEQARHHRAEVRQLKAERDEGLSPMVAVLQREVIAAKEKAQAAEQRASAAVDRHARTFRALRGVLMSCGFSEVEAFQIVSDAFAWEPGDETPQGAVVTELPLPTHVRRRDREEQRTQAMRVSRARGERL